MKNLILIFMALVSLASFSQRNSRERYIKTKNIELDKNQVAIMAKKNLYYYELKGNYAYPAEGFEFYTSNSKSQRGNMIFVLNARGKGKLRDFEINLEPYFAIMKEGVVMIYCSCGSNITDSDGDDCQTYQTSEGIQCGGGCSGDNDGATCSVTMFNTETGDIGFLPAL